MNHQQYKWNDLVTCYRQAIDLRIHLANSYWKTNELLSDSESGKHCSIDKLKALELDPNLVQEETHNQLASMFLEQGNIDEAIWSYTRAIITNPDHELAYIQLEKLLFQDKKLNDFLLNQKTTGVIFPTFYGQKDNLNHNIAQYLQNYGCVLIRNVFSYNKIQKIYDMAKDYYRFLENCKNNCQIDAIPQDYQFNYSKNSMSIFPFHEDHNWDDSIFKLFIDSHLLELMNLLLGNKFFFELQASRMRKHYDYKQQFSILPYHQDGTVVKVAEKIIVSGRRTKMLTCFIPLTSCGIDSPSLELIPLKFKWLFPKKILSKVLASIENLFIDSHLWHPQLEVGDVLIFDAMNIHRTYITEVMNRERISMDIRIFSYSD
jgi:ectoine hydroxylase-related dioxygenase (phytanoyl-CoA dioxygenase family)